MVSCQIIMVYNKLKSFWGGECMLIGLIFGLIVGWILSLFGGDLLLIQGFFELTGKQISSAGYYTIFALLGLIGGLIKDRS